MISIDAIRRKVSLAGALVAISLLLSLGASLIFWMSARQIASDYRSYRTRIESRPNAGVQLPPLTGKDIRGNSLRVGYEDQAVPTLLLVFSPRCPYCTKNWPSWSRLLAAVQENQARIVAVDPTGLTDAKYIESHNLNSVPLFMQVDYATAAAYNIQLVPTTMLIKPDGTVAGSWTGVLDEQAIGGLEALLRP